MQSGGPSLLSLGSINADFMMRTGAPLETAAMLAAHDLRRLGGGKAANVALLAARLGRRAHLLGAVGNDDLAEQALAPLREAGVVLDGVLHHAAATGVAMVLVPPDGKKRIVSAGEANFCFDHAAIEALKEVVAAAVAGSVLVCDYEITPQAVSCGVAAAHAQGLRVVIDPSFPDKVPHADLRLAYALTPNAEEATALVGIRDRSDDALVAAARALAACGPPVVCIKLDHGGCLFYHDSQPWHVPAAPVDVVDTTGAGDAFSGAFAVALLDGASVSDAVLCAVAASEVAVTTYGAQPSYPDRDRLMRQIRSAERPLTPWGQRSTN